MVGAYLNLTATQAAATLPAYRSQVRAAAFHALLPSPTTLACLCVLCRRMLVLCSCIISIPKRHALRAQLQCVLCSSLLRLLMTTLLPRTHTIPGAPGGDRGPEAAYPQPLLLPCFQTPTSSHKQRTQPQALLAATAGQQVPILSLAGPMSTQAAALEAFNATVWPRA